MVGRKNKNIAQRWKVNTRSNRQGKGVRKEEYIIFCCQNSETNQKEGEKKVVRERHKDNSARGGDLTQGKRKKR